MTTPSARRRSRLARDERGANLVEFALVSIPLLLLTLGLVDFGRVIWAYNGVVHATREGARFALVRGGAAGADQASVEDIRNAVRAQAVGLDGSQLTISVVWDPDNQPGSRVIVTSTYPFRTVSALMSSWATINLTSRTEVVIAR